MRRAAPYARAALALLAAFAVAVTGCSQEDVVILEPDQVRDDHGFEALATLVADHATASPGAEGYRQFVRKVDALRPRFDQEIANLANLHVAFRALPVIEAVADRSLAEQLDALATTVFPVAFGLPVMEGESQRAYLERLCGEERPELCRDVVPEGWAVVLPALAGRALKQHAIVALARCVVCTGAGAMRRRLEQFSDHVAAAAAVAAAQEPLLAPDRWPQALARARPWRDLPVLAASDGQATLDGEPLPINSWVAPLAAARDDGVVLGVHLRPTETAKLLRAIAGDARRAGYRELLLQARRPAFPYELVAYPLSLTNPRGRALEVRDVDPIRMVVRTLDFQMPDDGPPMSLP